MQPKYDLDKIKFAVGNPTFERAVDLYEGEKITQFKEDIGGYSAIVIGTKPYRVSVSVRYYDQGSCECYLGQNETLCKHMAAVAIYATMCGKKLNKEDKELLDGPKCSGKMGELSKEGLTETKQAIALASKHIRAYNGPSKFWFVYQNSLGEGCARLSKLVSELPASEQTTKLLVEMLLRLDKKICTGGVDDSDGTVGGFIYQTVEMLQEYVKLDPRCIKSFKKLCGRETCFGWEEPLVKIFDEQNIHHSI
ncbi:MAG: hypothetical protein ACD_58C00042G0001 [uncultured bacterium]|nr:MAG: hypothetical protein ACD_58C00042G0001 [uncultured bacterium]